MTARNIKTLLSDTTISKNIQFDPNFEFVVFEKQHQIAGLEVFKQTFCDYEPMTHYLGIDYAAFQPFGERVIDKAVRDQMSVAAIDKTTKQIAALAISEDLIDPLAIDFAIDPRFNIIFMLLEQLGQPFFSNKQLIPKRIAHLFITAVDKRYFCRRLSRQINFCAMAWCAQQNYTHMYCEFTHHFNERGTVKYIPLVKELIGDIVYQDFIFEGKKPFANLAYGAKSYLWQIRPEVPIPW